MSTDSFSSALGRLDPASRALLDLSLRRGMRPEEIGDLLGTDPESVIVAREQALEQLAARLGVEDLSQIDDLRARLAELPAGSWTPPPPEPDAPADPVEGTPQSPTPAIAEWQERGRDTHSRRTERRRLPLLLTLAAITAIALIVVLATNGQSDTQAPTPQPAATKPAPRKKLAKPAPTKKPIALTNPTGAAGGATSTAALTRGGKRLVLDVKGLPDPHGGSYQVWLYSNVIDSRSIGSAHAGSFKLDVPLPANASHFRDVDVSREPHDGNPNHSGASVLRVALAKLAR